MSKRINKVKSVLNKMFKANNSDSEIFPATVLIDMANYCNQRCSMFAGHVMTRKRGIMESGFFKKVVRNVEKEIKAILKQDKYNDLPSICRDYKDWQATKVKYY